MSTPSVIERLEASDPLGGIDTTGEAERLRARALAVDPIPARRRPRRRWAAALATGATALAALAVLALAPAHRDEAGGVRAGLPGPVAAFAAEVADAKLLHVRRVDVGFVGADGAVTPVRNPERSESWIAMDNSGARTDYLDAEGKLLVEAVRKGDELYILNPQLGLTQRIEEPRDDASGAWLVRLRRGIADPSFHVVGRREVRGRETYEVAFDQNHSDGRADDTRAFVSVRGGDLVRVEQLDLPGNDAPDRWLRTDVDAFDAGPADAKQLEPAPQFRSIDLDGPVNGRLARP